MEEWKPCQDFPSYDISTEGRVRNRKTGKILKTNISKNGYERVTLSENGITKTINVHKLVADTYISGFEKGMGVLHKDNDILNSNPDNLEWGTKSEIARKSFENGRTQKHRMKPILCVETGEQYKSIKDCARKIHKDRRTVSRCVNNPATRTKEGYHYKPLN